MKEILKCPRCKKIFGEGGSFKEGLVCPDCKVPLSIIRMESGLIHWRISSDSSEVDLGWITDVPESAIRRLKEKMWDKFLDALDEGDLIEALYRKYKGREGETILRLFRSFLQSPIQKSEPVWVYLSKSLSPEEKELIRQKLQIKQSAETSGV